MEQGGLHLDYLVGGGPAQEAGLRRGDVILEWGEKKMTWWHGLYKKDIGAYLESHMGQGTQSIPLEVLRDGVTQTIYLDLPLAATGRGLWSLTVRFLFVVLLGVIALFMVFSKSIDRLGYVTALGLCFATLSILSGARYTQLFMGPFIGWMDEFQYVIVSMVSTISTLGFLGSCAWFVIVFKDRASKALAGLVFGMPFALISVFFSFSTGSWSQRTAAVYPLKLFVVASLLGLTLVLMIHAYLTCQSVVERVRIRWIGLTLVFFAVFHLSIWVFPKWVLDRPLVSNIDWLLIPYSLVPLSLLLSIHKHHLFGIRGLVKSRIKRLEKQLHQYRERDARKEVQIQWLTQELGQLQAELADHDQNELGSEQLQTNDQRLLRLEMEHPFLRELRQTKLISHHPSWTDIFENVVLGARMERSVLIIGESGTGKTHIAEALHQLSSRAGKVYREVSCAQFEHSDPAFALGKFFGVGKDHGLPNYPKEGRRGLLQECDGGTLFLDDVDRLPLNVQDLLLYPLEGKPFEAGIGTGGPYTVSVKFIFATNRNLAEMVGSGQFRGDILARMGTRVALLPLRERREDIRPIIEFMQHRICAELKHSITSISPKAMKLLTLFPYEDGNIRQLKLELEAAMGKAMLAGDHVLRAGYLSPALQGQPSPPLSDIGKPKKPDSNLATTRPTEVMEKFETRELLVLRKHLFRIKESEVELGLSHKSRTLSNYLRGICLQALYLCDWDLLDATEKVVGPNYPDKVDKVFKKMERYVQKIRENEAAGKEASLFNNLPGSFHGALKAGIERAKRERLGKMD